MGLHTAYVCCLHVCTCFGFLSNYHLGFMGLSFSLMCAGACLTCVVGLTVVWFIGLTCQS